MFDLEAVNETVAFARELRKPYAVVINGAPPRRDGVESPMVTHARESLLGLRIPVWGGQVTQRANFSLALAEGEGATPRNVAPVHLHALLNMLPLGLALAERFTRLIGMAPM